MLKGCVLLVFLSLCSVCVDAQTYYVLRHFEKLPTQLDPGLTSVGERRAEALVELLRDKSIRYLFTTDYARTRATVAPLAKARGLSVRLYDPRVLAALAAQLQTLDAVLIVGHSNTTPQLVRLLGGTADAMQEQDFGDLYVLTRTGDRVATQRLSVALPPLSP